jgi:DnaJ-class molecular chaperone
MQVTICNHCEGRGSFWVRDHDGGSERQCKKCAGAGRLLRKQYTIEIPFGEKPQEYVKADEKIIKVIQKLNEAIK